MVAEQPSTGALSSGKASVLSAIHHFAREKPMGAAGAVILLLTVLVAILAPWISPQDPISTNTAIRLSPPSLEHPLGTDDFGRDTLSRVIYGARVSVVVGISATLLGTTVGALIGVASGYIGGKVDLAVQRIMDVMMAFPTLILAIAVMAVLGGSIGNVIVAISVSAVPGANRVGRSVAVSVKEFQFVEAAKAIGASPARILFDHVMPNCLAAYLIIAAAMLGAAVIIEAALSFLGIGVPAPTPSWGRSLSEAMAFYYTSPWAAIFPGVALSLYVFAANMFGDAVRDVLDPRLKRL